MKFWNYAKDFKSNEKTIFNLYSNGLLNIMLNLTSVPNGPFQFHPIPFFGLIKIFNRKRFLAKFYQNRKKEPDGTENGPFGTLNLTIKNKEFENYKSITNVFWYLFHESFDANSNSSNEKSRILSIIIKNFTYEKLMKNLQV